MRQKNNDIIFMRRALALAQKGAGRVAPNPLVGCVIVKNGKMIAEGFHKKFGGDHAEVVALKKLKFQASGATLYVTLEPCHHFGKTPPCVDAVIRSGIKKVIVAMKDPDPRTSGKSIVKMRRAGLQVKTGICRQEAQNLNSAFIKHTKAGLPYVIVKVAQSQDGMISSKQGQQGWITGVQAKKYVQKLRREVDAVLVGRGTAEIDNPRLNVRLATAPQPRRVILDSNLSLSLKSRLFQSVGGPVILVCSKTVPPSKIRQFEKAGAQVLPVKKTHEGLDLVTVLHELARKGVTSILIEGGAQIFTSFAKQLHLTDEWIFITAPKVIGKMGKPAFRHDVNQPKLRLILKTNLGDDQMIRGRVSSRPSFQMVKRNRK